MGEADTQSLKAGPFQGRRSAPFFLLRSASYVYGLVLRLRLFLFRKGLLTTKCLPLKVLSIGNLTVGGTGKTPHTALLALYLKNQGIKTAVLSRGYRGSKMKDGAVISDGLTLLGTVEEGGEEPFWLAGNLPGIPVVVGRDRFRSGMLCYKTWQTEWVVLDDGFQHLRLHRDINILLISGTRPFESDRLLPRGFLREPLEGMERADMILITHSERMGEDRKEQIIKTIRGKVPALPLFFSSHKPVSLRPISGNNTLPLSTLEGKKVIGFCGLADPESFDCSLQQLGANPVGMITFADHHHYLEKDKKALEEVGRRSEIDFMVTTEKDAVKLGNWKPAGFQLLVLGIAVEVADQAFYHWLNRKIRPEA